MVVKRLFPLPLGMSLVIIVCKIIRSPMEPREICHRLLISMPIPPKLIEADDQQSVMRAAILNGVKGIVGGVRSSYVRDVSRLC